MYEPMGPFFYQDYHRAPGHKYNVCQYNHFSSGHHYCVDTIYFPFLVRGSLSNCLLFSLPCTVYEQAHPYIVNQWFSTSLTPFNTVPHVVWAQTIKLFSQLLRNYSIATVANHSVNIWYFQWWQVAPVKGSFVLPSGRDPQVESSSKKTKQKPHNFFWLYTDFLGDCTPGALHV